MDVELKRRDDIWKLPEILIVHLKRFHTTKYIFNYYNQYLRFFFSILTFIIYIYFNHRTTISKLDIQVDFSFE